MISSKYLMKDVYLHSTIISINKRKKDMRSNFKERKEFQINMEFGKYRIGYQKMEPYFGMVGYIYNWA